MAQRGPKLEQDKLCCSVCLDLMKDPATIPCGHSFCLNCIRKYWDEEQSHSCPQCRQSFSARPALVRSAVLAELLEEKRTTGPQAGAEDPDSIQSGDVECDFCSEKKLKAVRSCLQCLVSYCEQHLQPHFTVSALKKHRLVEPSRRLEDSVCPLHGEVMKIFCRTDQSCICYLCLMDEHEGHQTLSAAAEMSNKQKELEASLEEVQQRIQDRQQEVKQLRQVVEDINQSADEASRDGEKIFTDVKQQIRSRQKSEVNKAKELQERLEQEITELRRRTAVLEELRQTREHIQFLQTYSALSRLGEAADLTRIDVQSLSFNRDAAETASELREKLQELLSEEWTQVPPTRPDVEVLLPQPEPKTRDQFLEYACPLRFDRRTENKCVKVKKNLTAEYYDEDYPVVVHPDVFTSWPQILCREALTGRCYWEVEWKAENEISEVFIAVSYKDISRDGPESVFGNNQKSWALQCNYQGYEIRHNGTTAPVSAPVSYRTGVYLDHSAGTLSFYRVSDNIMTLLHRVQAMFTQPLCPGLGVYNGASAQFCNLWSKY
ncbi:E3 ubiquitin-protein ligase TRIM47-like [Anableps anableps]